MIRWNKRSKEKELEFLGHKDWIRQMITMRGRIWSCSDDGSIKVWDEETGNLLQSNENHRAGVNSLSIDKVNQEVLSASSDKNILRWDALTYRLLGEFALNAHHGRIVQISGVDASGRIWSSSSDKTIKIWSKERKKTILQIEEKSVAYCFLNVGDKMWVAFSNGIIQIYSSAISSSSTSSSSLSFLPPSTSPSYSSSSFSSSLNEKKKGAKVSRRGRKKQKETTHFSSQSQFNPFSSQEHLHFPQQDNFQPLPHQNHSNNSNSFHRNKKGKKREKRQEKRKEEKEEKGEKGDEGDDHFKIWKSEDGFIQIFEGNKNKTPSSSSHSLSSPHQNKQNTETEKSKKSSPLKENGNNFHFFSISSFFSFFLFLNRKTFEQ